MVYRLKVAEPHILGLDLFILASSGHLLYRWRVHTVLVGLRAVCVYLFSTTQH